MAKNKQVKRGKASKAKMAKASNACCPIIHTHCVPTYISGAKVAWAQSQYGESAKKVKVSGPTKCSVKFGSKAWNNLSTEAKDKKVASLTKALTAKRCVALVSDSKEKKAQRIAKAEARRVEKSLKSMY